MNARRIRQADKSFDFGDRPGGASGQALTGPFRARRGRPGIPRRVRLPTTPRRPSERGRWRPTTTGEAGLEPKPRGAGLRGDCGNAVLVGSLDARAVRSATRTNRTRYCTDGRVIAAEAESSLCVPFGIGLPGRGARWQRLLEGLDAEEHLAELHLGGVANVFPNRTTAERFVQQVNERVAAARVSAGRDSD